MAVVILKSSGGSTYYMQTIIVQGLMWRWGIDPTEGVSSGTKFWLWDSSGPIGVSMPLDQLSAMSDGLVEDACKSIGTLPGGAPWP